MATVLTDLATVVGDGADLYADVLNEFLAVDVVPELVTADESRAQWRPDGAGTRLTVHVEYREPLPPDKQAAAHFAETASPIPAWDAVALSSVVRNRHSILAVRALSEDIRG